MIVRNPFGPRLVLMAGTLCILAGCSGTAPEVPPDDGDQSNPAPQDAATPKSGEFVEPGASSSVELSDDYVDQLQNVADHTNVQVALQTIVDTDEQTLADMVTLTEIEAPPFKEERRAKFYAQMLSDAGLPDVSIDEVGNVVGRRKGTKGERTLAFTAHLDTVFPEGTDVKVRTDNGRYMAPGIGDDVRGLATLLTVLRAMNAHELKTEDDVLFVGTVGEEGLGDLRGVKHLFREGAPKIDAFITVDGTGDQGVTHEGLGSHRYRVTYKGPGGHSWGAFGLANPHHALGAAIKYWVDAADEYTKEDENPDDSAHEKTSYNVGRISGGTSVNSIPFEAVMEVDMRSESVARLEEIDDLFQKALARALDEQNTIRRSGPPLELVVDRIGDRPSGELPQSTPLVQWAFAATAYFDHEAIPGRGSTDANVPIAAGIPGISIGGGGKAGGYHALDEWYDNDGGPEGIQRALLIVLGQAGFAP